MAGFRCISPVDGSTVFEAPYCDPTSLSEILSNSAGAQTAWANMPLSERIGFLQRASDILYDQRDEIGREITQQMGRPIRYSPSELAGVKERSDMMLALAPTALADIRPIQNSGFETWIAREPLGIVAVLAPWNYPFLTSINAIIPALAAGNSVILKHSAQTPLTALRYKQAFESAGLPEYVFQTIFLDHDGAANLVSDALIDYVAFTGSVGGGRAINRALSEKFIGAGLELGGKDPAFVREDADVDNAAVNLADGSFFNSGQSCCGIERIYVHRNIYEAFLSKIIVEAEQLKLGDPTDPDTTLGPLASASGADMVRRQIADALAAGASANLPIDDNWGSAYLAPQVLTNVSHEMDVMTEESFGPVVGIMPVDDDDQAIALMNDSEYGLTASIWSNDLNRAKIIGQQLATGTVFLNRCDYLDPALAWTGVKNSGRGCTLSSLGYEQLTRPKSYHFKLPQEL